MQVEILHAVPAQRRSAQIVLLPGLQQRSKDFERAGWISSLQRAAPDVQLSLITPELAHLNDRDWLARLQGHVAALSTAPVWIGGVSLGAFMALRYAAAYPSGFEGLCLLAPYLGSRLVWSEIARCAGLAHWQAEPLDADDDERRVWIYAKSLGSSAPRVFLGLGREDRFADSQRLLAEALPPACTSTHPGGHDWPVWRQLWEHFLDQNLHRGTPALGALR